MGIFVLKISHLAILLYSIGHRRKKGFFSSRSFLVVIPP
jgi:hypothetical protein